MDDLEKAKTQLSEALKWRKEYKPLEAKNEVFDADKFGGLGYVTTIRGVKATTNDEDVVSNQLHVLTRNYDVFRNHAWMQKAALCDDFASTSARLLAIMPLITISPS